MADADANKRVQWFVDGIKQNYINYHEFDTFQDIQRINSGGFGNVFKANWKGSDIVVALKSFRNDRSTTMKEIVNELRLLHEVDFHTNIIRSFGITKRKNEDSIDPEYMLILEYADGGTLRNYLEENFNRLDFNMKLQFAIQIADAVSCLHQRNIIHRDLHSKNILVHKNKIKLADFGLSRRLNEVSNSVKDIFGVLPYIDPQLHKGHYKANKKSDVYSVGILLWEISSGKQPFESNDSHQIPVLLLEGKRETSIPGTPIDYINIYTRCWQDNPDNRPEIQQVFSELKQISLNTNEMKTLSTDENVNTLIVDDINYSATINLDYNEKIVNELLSLYENYIHEEDCIQSIKQHIILRNKSEKEIFNYLLENKENIIPLANFYQYGIGTEEDKIFKLCDVAAEKGIVPASYINGIRVERNEEKAFQLCNGAIEKNENLKIDNRKEGESTFDSTLPKKIINEPNALKEEAVPFTEFVPLINQIRNLFNEVINITQAAEHNGRICNALKQRVGAADLTVLDLQTDDQEIFNIKTYLCLQNLVTIITQIKKFIADIYQMNTLLKFIRAKNIEKTFKELCREFDSCICILIFTTTIKNKIRPDEEVEKLKADQDNVNNHVDKLAKEIGNSVGYEIKELQGEVKELKDEAKELKDEVKGLKDELRTKFSSMVLKINAINNTMEKLPGEHTKNENELKFSDYKETPRRGGRVAKWVNFRNNGEELAFKSISDEEKINLQNQVTILKELHNCQNIIKFYGLTRYGNKWYLVTEWAEYGNLREYYTSRKDLFNFRLKLRISLDIARGLNFLRTVEVVHRDIRAENILITINDTAKLANFKLSRTLTADSLKQSQHLERVRYCAPELLERVSDSKYDHSCEVYSFGILLWEIAEEKIPYQDYKDIVKIADLVLNKMYRESFSESSPMPQKFKNLAIQAVNHDPKFRPEVTEIFDILRDCFESFEKPLHIAFNSTVKHCPKDPLSTMPPL